MIQDILLPNTVSLPPAKFVAAGSRMGAVPWVVVRASQCPILFLVCVCVSWAQELSFHGYSQKLRVRGSIEGYILLIGCSCISLINFKSENGRGKSKAAGVNALLLTLFSPVFMWWCVFQLMMCYWDKSGTFALWADVPSSYLKFLFEKRIAISLCFPFCFWNFPGHRIIWRSVKVGNKGPWSPRIQCTI